MRFRIGPAEAASMWWPDFIAFVDQVDDFESQEAKAEAQRRLGEL